MTEKLSVADIAYSLRNFRGERFSADIVDKETGEVVIPCFRKVTVALLIRAAERRSKLVAILPCETSRHEEFLAALLKAES